MSFASDSALSPGRSVYRSPAGRRLVEARYRDFLDRWSGQKSELRIPTCEGETFVVACGDEHLPPLILLHGAQANAAAWKDNAVRWSKRFRCYAVDLIGEAGFSSPSRLAFEGDAHARWLDDVMRGLGLSRASFVGVSLGGWLALDYARYRPEAFDRLVVLCPGGVGRQKNFLFKVAPLLLLGPWGMRRIRAMVFGKREGEVAPEAQPLLDLMASIARYIRPRIVRLRQFTDAELASLAMPLLAIVGGKDVLFDSEGTRRRLQAHAPNAEVVFLPESRHVIFGQADTVFAFLAKER